jgi:hypothetical protein
MQEIFGENSTILAQAKDNKLILEIIADSAGLSDDERQRKSDEFMVASLNLGDDYAEMLELIRSDTGFKNINMQVWHYFDEILIYTQDLS